MSATSVYFVTVEELLGRRQAFANGDIRVAGRVGTGVEMNKGTLQTSFQLTSFNGSGTVPVQYTGILPDMFAEGRDVIVEGTYGAGGTLHARTLLTSCPSKYEAEIPKN